MKIPKDPKQSRKITKVVESAETLFIHYGIKRITVEEICRTAEVSKMTFYKYFSNKIELIKHIWNHWVDEGLEKIEEIEALNVPFPEKIHQMFQWRADLLSKMRTESIEEIIHSETDLKKINQRARSFILDAQRNGEIRPTLRPELIIAAWDKLIELGGDDKLQQGYPDASIFQRDLKDFFWFGVLTGKYASI